MRHTPPMGKEIFWRRLALGGAFALMSASSWAIEGNVTASARFQEAVVVAPSTTLVTPPNASQTTFQLIQFKQTLAWVGL